jgi:RNA polymerase sigma factor (sigma-70 family)
MDPTKRSPPSRVPSQKARNWADSLAATRLSLLTRLKKHDDHEGWQRFFDTYGGVVHGFAQRSGLSGVEADEALQETMLSVAKEMPGFRYDPGKGSFKGWLFAIARRRIADQFRGRIRRQRDGGTLDQMMEQVPDPNGEALNQVWDEEWRQNHLQLAIARVKEKVAPRQWQMFDLAAMQQWKTERICDVLRVNRAQLYMAKMRVSKLLKLELAALRDDKPCT